MDLSIPRRTTWRVQVFRTVGRGAVFAIATPEHFIGFAMPRFTTFALLLTASSLTACAKPQATRSPRIHVAAATPCDVAIPVSSEHAAWTVEGFDGAGDSQLLITRRVPVKRCAARLPTSGATVRGRAATMAALP
jgi:hypothetical protein